MKHGVKISNPYVYMKIQKDNVIKYQNVEK